MSKLDVEMRILAIAEALDDECIAKETWIMFES